MLRILARVALIPTILIIGAISFSIFASSVARGAINNQISFQGKLTNPDGTNVTNGSYSILFTIYSGGTTGGGGSSVWTETQSPTVTDGVFQVNLGSVTSLPGSVDFNTSDLFLSVKVGADPEMLPRIAFTASPYAFNSDRLGGIAATGFVQLSPSGQQTGAINISGNATIGGTYNGNTFSSSALTFSAASTATLQSAASQALNFTGNAASTVSTTAGNLTIQGGSGTVSLGTSTILNATGALTINSGAATALTIDSGTTGALNIGNSANAKTITIGNTTLATAITLQSGTGALRLETQGTGGIQIGNNAVAQVITIGNSTGATNVVINGGSAGIQVGTNAIAQTVTIGNATGASSVVVNAGTGNIDIGTGAQARATNIATGGANQVVTLGSSNGTSSLNLQSGTGTIGIGTSASARATNIATGGAVQTVTVGSTNSTSSLTLQSGTGALNIQTQGTGGINIGTNAVAQTITLGNTTGATKISNVLGATTATDAFSITGASSAVFLRLDTTNNRLYVGNPTADGTAFLLVLDYKNTTGDPTGVNGGQYYNSFSNKFRCYQNSIWQDCVNEFNTLTKTADQIANVSSTAFQDVTGLGFAVNANTSYVFDAWIPINDSNTTADLKYTFTTPAGSTIAAITSYFTSATAVTNCNISTSGQTCAKTTGNSTNGFIQMKGQVTVAGTAGTVQFRFAQNGSSPTSFPIIKKGATLSWHQSN
jgi:hypothetical protein